jgi:carboxypeptidase Q
MEEFERVKESLKGAWLLSAPTRAPRSGSRPPERTEPTDLEKAVAVSGYAGRVTASNDELVITGGRHNVEWEKLPSAPSVTIRKSDMDAVREKLAAGQPVELEFDIQQRVFKGPRKNYNVVAEIPGTEKPDEVVIISGHLDSWDGPGSEGAQDNGTGTMVALEAARILNKVGAKPKRTIRFILWTGEEQGLFGSLGYVKTHKDELGKISAVFVDDGGTNYQGGLLGTPEMEPFLREALTPAMDAFPEMPITLRTAPKLSRMSGSDHYPFVAAGVPGFFWNESGRGNYREVHHTQNDKLETVMPEYLIQSSTNSAAAAYILACAPTLLPRESASQPGGN